MKAIKTAVATVFAAKATAFAAARTVVAAPVRVAAVVLAAVAATSASATEWTYSSADKAISDGQWTLSVKSLDKASGTIQLGDGSTKCVTGWSQPSDETKSGVIDLRSPLVLKVDGEDDVEIASVKLGNGAFSGSADVIDFYCDVVSEMGRSCFNGCTALAKVEIGGSAGVLSAQVFQGSAITNATISFPNLTNVANHVFYNRKTMKADVMGILAPGVTDIGGCAFYNCYELTGTLTLTNIHTFGGEPFYACKGLSEIFLAGPCSELGNQAFYDCSGLKRATFDLAEDVTVGSQTFGKWSPPAFESIRFLRKPFNAASMTNVLYNASGRNNARKLTAENACKVYVSKRQWPAEEREACGWWRPATAETLSEEELAAMPQGCIGVAEIVLPNEDVWGNLKGCTQRAWIVHKASPYDKSAGMVIVVK